MHSTAAEKTKAGVAAPAQEKKKLLESVHKTVGGEGQTLRLAPTPVQQAIMDLLTSGVSVLPCMLPSKRPSIDTWTHLQKRRADKDELLTWTRTEAVGVIAGEISGGLECLDFDCAGAAYDAWAAQVEQAHPGLLSRLYMERSPSGGRHVVYRCRETGIPGAMKLAERPYERESGEPFEVHGKRITPKKYGDTWIGTEVLIETRGEGSYFVAAPSAGYEALQGALTGLPDISADERFFMLQEAATLNEWTPPTSYECGVGGQSYEKRTDRPGDDFNTRPDPDPSELIIELGWTPCGRQGIYEHFTRPGKDSGTSASLIEGTVFKVFTTNAPPFEGGRAYSPFFLYTQARHGGSFSAAARELAQRGFGKPKQEQADMSGWVPYDEFERGLEAHKKSGPLMRRLSDVNAEAIPARDWIMSSRFVPKYVTLTVAPGGGSKSTLSTLEAVAVATGRNLTGMEVLRPGAVWLYNSEDPTDEMERKLAACCMAHGIDHRVIHNVFYRSGQDETAFVFVRMDPQHGLMVNARLVGEVIESIKAAEIALMVLDPFVGTHRVNENDNMQIESVLTVLRRIANATECAVHIVHHTRKLGKEGGVGDAETARGASSNVSASRVSHTLNVMTKAEAKDHGIPEERAAYYVRLDDAKNNFGRPDKSTLWFERSGVVLPNGKDEVGVLKRAGVRKLDAVAAENTEQIIAERILGTITRQEQAGGRPWSASAFAKQHAAEWKDEILGVGELKIAKCIKLLIEDGKLRQSKERLEGDIRSIDYLRAS